MLWLIRLCLFTARDLHSFMLMKSQGHLHYFLGLKLNFPDGPFFLSQLTYVVDRLQHVSPLDAKPVETPIAPKVCLSLPDGNPLPDATQHKSIGNALQYVTITRFNISFAVNRVCQFMHQPTSIHW